jgi:hypothetical protein
MLFNKLVTRADISAVRQISETIYDDVLDAIIIETQIQDIQPLLGEFLFNAVINDPNDYVDLLEGHVYTYSDLTFHNYGLKTVIAFYVYARLKMYGGAIDTPFSTIEKLEGADSRPISDKTKKDLYQMNRDSGYKIWQSVQNYLLRIESPEQTLYLKTYPYNQKTSQVNMTISKIE